jgi:hypothetical protein
MGHTYPAHGWLPEGAHFSLQRSDQGRDFVTNWQGIIQAPGDGVCTEVRADRPFPNGFGPRYAIVRMTSGSFAKGSAPGAPPDFTGEWYIGHCTARVKVGDRFGFGHPLAVADQGKDFNATHGGWVELGTKMANGSLGPNSSTGHWFDALLRQPLTQGGPVTGAVAMVDMEGGAVNDIPRDFWNQRKVAGYTTQAHPTDGIAWTDGQFALFPHCIRIDQSPGLGMARNARVKDVEAGGARIADVVAIAESRHAARLPFTVYIQDSNLKACRDAMRAAGVPNGYVTYWIANWNLNEAQAEARLGGDVVALQWASPTSNPQTILPGSNLTLQRANADLSVAIHSWPGPAPVHP